MGGRLIDKGWFTLIINLTTFSIIFWGRFLSHRIRWVMSVRFAVRIRDETAYKALPSFSRMLWRVWVWDVSKIVEIDRIKRGRG